MFKYSVFLSLVLSLLLGVFSTSAMSYQFNAAEPETSEETSEDDESEDVELDEDGNPIVEPDMAPSWRLSNGSDLEVSSEGLKGKPYVIHFWATWCPYCKELQPGLDSIAQDYIKDGINTYAVSFWENRRAKPIEEMASRFLELPVLIEGDEVANAFGVVATPSTYFVSGEGEIMFTYLLSNPNDPQLRVAYEALLASMNADD